MIPWRFTAEAWSSAQTQTYQVDVNMSYTKPVGGFQPKTSNLQETVHDFVAEGFGSMLVQIAQAFLNLLFTPDVIQADGQPARHQQTSKKTGNKIEVSESPLGNHEVSESPLEVRTMGNVAKRLM